MIYSFDKERIYKKAVSALFMKCVILYGVIITFVVGGMSGSTRGFLTIFSLTILIPLIFLIIQKSGGMLSFYFSIISILYTAVLINYGTGGYATFKSGFLITTLVFGFEIINIIRAKELFQQNTKKTLV